MIVNCVAYQDGRRLADIRVEEISEYLKRPGCFVWVALKDPSNEELDVMRAEFDLHPLAVEDASHGHQRPKIDEYGDSLFAVLHIVELREDDVDVAELSVFAGPNYILSVRKGTEHGFVAVRERAEREPELLRHGSGFVLYALMDNVVDRYFPVVDALEVELERLEGRIFAGTTAQKNIEELYNLKHKLMVLRHAVEPLIEVTHRLYGGRVPQVCLGTQEYFRDIHDHLLRVSQALDGLRDMVGTAMSVNLSLITLAENEVTKRLASYAALIAVPTLIAGIEGMNFKHMPELEWLFGYPASLLLMFVIDWLLFRNFRRVGWL
ncbi:MAG TPA: magnesium/cobalt transporter CorA [Usitatibacter sp.]|nr:magnesium/cobalt transporter CorA [Usitatibacter sp.]